MTSQIVVHAKGHDKRSHASIGDAFDNVVAFEANHSAEVLPLTKYDIPLRVKSKVQNYKSVLPRCPTLKLWDIQNKYKFGFIPLGDPHLPEQVLPKNIEANTFDLHKVI